MKFYKRFPGDIIKKTSGLTMAQFGAYDRLIDWCYANELPIDPEEVYTITHAMTPADRRDVDRVLAKFFTLAEDGYRQERIDEVIAEALPKIEAARENGKKGGRPKGTNKKPSGLSEQTNELTEGFDSQKASQSQNKTSPLRSEDSEANASAAGAAPKTPAELTKAELWAAGKSLLIEDGLPEKQAGSFVGGLCKTYGDAIVVEAVRATVVHGPAGALEYLKATCQRMAGERKPVNKQEALEADGKRVAREWLTQQGAPA